jgi:signal transduction histidine kinase
VTSEGEPPRQAETIAHLWAQAAHDLRQPAQAALLVAKVLEQASGRTEQKHAARHVAATVESLGEMLEVLALLSRIEAGLQVVPLRPCRLPEVLKSTMREMAEIAKERSIPLRFRSMQGVVRSNARLLALAARSLLLNAIQLGNGDGILVRCRRRGSQLWLEAQFRSAAPDVGSRRNAFVQLAPLPDRPIADNLGLGLLLLEHLCRRLGHNLHCTSSPRDGKLLAIELPLAPASR